MEALTAFDPRTEVLGQAMLALVECIRSDYILPILDRHGLSDIDREAWYPHQDWLDVFKDIASDPSAATPTLVAAGMKFAETAMFPPEISTLEDALIAINDGYQLNHRNGYAGEYAVVIMGPGHIQVIDHTPYPDDFTYGLIYALAHRFSPEGAYPIVRHDPDSPCRKQGADTCTYDVEW